MAGSPLTGLDRYHSHPIRHGNPPSSGIFKAAPALVEFDFPAQLAGKNGVGLGFSQLERLLRGLERVGKITRLGIGGGQCVKDYRIVAAG